MNCFVSEPVEGIKHKVSLCSAITHTFLIHCLLREWILDPLFDFGVQNPFVSRVHLCPNARLTMVRYYENETTFRFNWEKVATAFWCRYPNPER